MVFDFLFGISIENGLVNDNIQMGIGFFDNLCRGYVDLVWFDMVFSSIFWFHSASNFF